MMKPPSSAPALRRSFALAILLLTGPGLLAQGVLGVLPGQTPSALLQQQNSSAQAATPQSASPSNIPSSAAQTATSQQAPATTRSTSLQAGPFARGNAAPDRLTDFQRLVQETTGQQLAVFGASIFINPPSTFAPVDDAPVTPDYVIGPGDELRLQLWGQVNQQGDYVVDRSGSISVPQLGTVHVAGVAFSDLNNFLRAQFSRVYRNFDLNVNLGQLRSIQVFVVGQARTPGSYTISSLSTLLNALFASGGPSAQGSLRNIQVLRGKEVVTHFDLYDLLLRGDKSHDVHLLPGDVIFISPVGPQVALLGSVNNSGIYELHGETTVGSLLALSGGESNLASTAQVRLERVFEHDQRSVTSVAESDLNATPLQNGDVITVSSIVDRFRNAVTLRGNVANPGRYPWHQGMHVTDLLPSREALITRDYWTRRNQLGLNLPVQQPGSPAINVARGANSSSYGDSYGSSYASPATSPAPSDAPAASNSEGSIQVAPNPGPGTGSTASGAASTPGQSGSASGGGNSVAAASAASASLFSPRTDVALSAPDIDWSYAVIERQDATDLKTSLIPFNLGRAVLDHSTPDDPELLPNDVVTVFSTADIRVPVAQQTRFVRLEGEFKAAGVYSVRPGETLRQLVARAGGFTSDSYLYASQFTRLSTQRVEQQRLSDYADQLEAQVSSVSATQNARALNPSDAAAADASTAAARQSIGRLRQLQPIGRIVLQLKPDSEGIAALPDLPLEDGDRFIVPKISSSVYVEGQVYSANAFLFEAGHKTSRYLKLAGGPDREADRRRAFILRADGSVLSRQYADVNHALIYPGDTIVMPPMISKRAILRDLVDISSLVGQFGIGIAAINLLK